MQEIDIAKRRQAKQRLDAEPFTSVEAAVRGLCCVQAQDYYGAGWALGQRTRDVTAEQIDRLLACGTILRTHMMRPTWHFVLPEDIRWIQGLTASRVHTMNAGICRREGFDTAYCDRAARLIALALRGGKQLTRAEIGSTLLEGGIAASGLGLVCLLMYAELEQVICSGGRRGKEFTYALLSDRAPAVTLRLDRAEAIVKLADRYLEGHAPATARDFAWWSGLTITDARAAFASLIGKYLSCRVGNITYFVTQSDLEPQPAQRAVHLLPNFDESFVAYADRTAAIDPAIHPNRCAANVAFLGNVITVNGRVIGTWRRVINHKEVCIETAVSLKPGIFEAEALDIEVERYSQFLQIPARRL